MPDSSGALRSERIRSLVRELRVAAGRSELSGPMQDGMSTSMRQLELAILDPHRLSDAEVQESMVAAEIYLNAIRSKDAIDADFPDIANLNNVSRWDRAREVFARSLESTRTKIKVIVITLIVLAAIDLITKIADAP